MRSLTVRARVLIALMAVLFGAAVWASGALQRHTADVARVREVDAQLLLTSMLDQETGVRGFLLTRQAAFLDSYVVGRRTYAATLRRALAAAAGDPASRAAILAADRRARAWRATAMEAIDERRRTGKSTTTAQALGASG